MRYRLSYFIFIHAKSTDSFRPDEGHIAMISHIWSSKSPHELIITLPCQKLKAFPHLLYNKRNSSAFGFPVTSAAHKMLQSRILAPAQLTESCLAELLPINTLCIDYRQSRAHRNNSTHPARNANFSPYP